MPQREEFGRYQQYLARLGLGATGGGPGARYQSDLYDPYSTLYGLEETTAPLTRRDPGSYEDYLLTRGAGAKDIYHRAGGILRSLYGAGEQARVGAGLGFGTQYGEGGLPESAPTEVMSGAQQRALMGLALRPYFGLEGSSRFANRLPVEEQQYLEQQRRGTATSPSFLDYIRQKYGLGRFFG